MEIHAAFLFRQLKSQQGKPCCIFFLQIEITAWKIMLHICFNNLNQSKASHTEFFFQIGFIKPCVFVLPFHFTVGKPFCVFVIPKEIRSWLAILRYKFTNWNQSMASHDEFFFPLIRALLGFSFKKWKQSIAIHATFLFYQMNSQSASNAAFLFYHLKSLHDKQCCLFLSHLKSKHWKSCCVFVLPIEITA